MITLCVWATDFHLKYTYSYSDIQCMGLDQLCAITMYMSINIKFRNAFVFFKVSWTDFSNNFNKLQSYPCLLSETQKHAKTLKQLWSCKKKKLTVSFQFIYLHIIYRMGNNHEEKLKMNIRVNFSDMTSLIINTKIYQERYCRLSLEKCDPGGVFLRIY